MKNNNSGMRRGLIAGGNWIIDRVKLIDAYPQAEQLTTIRSQSEALGGAPSNVLLGLAKAGAPFPLIAAGMVGKDAPGETVLSECRKHKIDTKSLHVTDKASTAYTDVMTEARTGRRTFFHFRGANALWQGDGVDFKKNKAKLFHLGYLLLLDALDDSDPKFGTKAARLLASAREAGVKTSIDLVSESGDRFKTVVPPALKYVDYLLLNELEASQITGFKIRLPDGTLDTVTLRHAAGALLQLGVHELVIIHFPEGSFARTRKGEDVWQSAVKLPAKVIAGTTGAGDAFAAGVLWGLHEGWDMPRSLQNAVCLAAACLLDPTATGGIKPLAACLALGKKYGFRSALEGGD